MEALRLFLTRIVPIVIFIIWFTLVMKERTHYVKNRIVFAWYTNPIFIVAFWFIWKMLVNYFLTGSVLPKNG
jgi:hypothetical protein